MKMIELKCKECRTMFFRPLKEHKRTTKLGRMVFCSLSCSMSHINRNNMPPMSKNRRIECAERIKKYAGNRQDGLSPFRYFITKSKSKNRQHLGTPNITPLYLKTLWERQKGKCSYTNLQMILPKNTQAFHNSGSPIRASLDRIDSSKGYVEGNVEFVCYAINLAKNSFAREQMKEFLHSIALSITQP